MDTPFWVTAFLDLAAPDVGAGTSFWSAVTGYEVSPVRGDDGEFATLVPPAGDGFLRVQRRAEGASRVHLDLHVNDPTTAATRAERLGARVVVRSDLGHVVLVSPAGLSFCFVTHPAGTRPPPGVWPGGHRSIVDQVTPDIAPSAHDLECRFWRDLTGWDLRASPVATEFPEFSEFTVLGRGPGQPLRFL